MGEWIILILITAMVGSYLLNDRIWVEKMKKQEWYCQKDGNT